MLGTSRGNIPAIAIWRQGRGKGLFVAAIHASVETGCSGRHHATPTAAPATAAAIDAAAGTAGGSTTTSSSTDTGLVGLAAAATTTTTNKLLAKSSYSSTLDCARLLYRRGIITAIATAGASRGRIIKFKPWRWIGKVKD